VIVVYIGFSSGEFSFEPQCTPAHVSYIW